jgi:hypothetical protein
MVRAISAFMEFCYLARRFTLREADLDAMQDALARFHDERSIFIETGVMPDGISLPRQHALMHYRTHVELFGAPNGLCSSITESMHIKAVKKPWRRSNRHLPLGQMLLTNQRLDKLAAFKSHLAAKGLLFPNPSSILPTGPSSDMDDLVDDSSDEDDSDPGGARFRDDSSLEDIKPDTLLTRVQASVHLAQTRSKSFNLFHFCKLNLLLVFTIKQL